MRDFIKKLINRDYSKKEIFIIFFAISSLFFLQLPLHQSLPGNWDTWLYLHLFNYYPDYIYSLIKGIDIYKPFFPDLRPPFIFGEPSFFNSILYLPIQWVTPSPIWSFYLFICLIFSLNGLGIFLISKTLSGSKFSALLAGFLLMFSNYMLCSLDQINVLSIYPSLFSVYYFLLFHRSQKNKHLLWGCIWAAIQVYCSGYHFMFLALTILILVLYKSKVYLMDYQKILLIIKATIFISVLVFPYLYIYVLSDLSKLIFNSVDERILDNLSIHFKDFFQTHPYNILYGDGDDKGLLYYIKSISPGFSMVVLFILAVFKSKYKSLILILFLFFMGIATGPDWVIMKNPTYILMNFIGLDQLMRTPVRAYVVILVMASILSAEILKHIFERKFHWGIIILLLFSIENIPYKLQYYPSNQYIKPPKELITIANSLKFKEVLWIHPSKLYDIFEPVQPGLGQVNREYIYMYWQTQFKKNMVNGMNGYVPQVNIELRMNHQSINSITRDNQVFEVRNIYLKEMEY